MPEKTDKKLSAGEELIKVLKEKLRAEGYDITGYTFQVGRANSLGVGTSAEIGVYKTKPDGSGVFYPLRKDL